VAAILTVTLNPALDVCADVPVVEPDHKLHCVDASRTPGGGGINVARAIHRLGGQATAIFPAGGASGALLGALLEAEGVSVAIVPIEGTTREDFSVRETSTGHEYRFVLPGPPLRSAELAGCLDEILQRTDPGSFVVLSGSVPAGTDLDALAALVHRLQASGAHVVVDTSGDALTALARVGVFLLKPSLNELRGHAGRKVTSIGEIVDAAEDLREGGRNHAVLVSLGADGALLVADGQPPCTIAAPPLRVVSAVGAGDSLVAGLVLGLAAGEPLLEAVRRGVAAGSAATISAGHHLCQPTDLEALLPAVRSTPMRLEPSSSPRGRRVRSVEGSGGALRRRPPPCGDSFPSSTGHSSRSS
jgi:6-phosphofructokinase 2